MIVGEAKFFIDCQVEIYYHSPRHGMAKLLGRSDLNYSAVFTGTIVLMPFFAQHAIVPRYRNSGWAISFATHSVGAGIAVILLSGIHPPNLPEPFRWDVSVTEKPAPVPNVKPSQPVQPSSVPVKTTPQQRADTNPVIPKERHIIENKPVSRSVQSQPSILTKASEITERTIQAQARPQETVQLQTPLIRELESVNKTAEMQTVSTTSTPIEEAIRDNAPPITRQSQAVESDSETHAIVTQQNIQKSAESPVVERNVVTDSTAKAESVETVAPIETASVQTNPIVNSAPVESATKHAPIQSDLMPSPTSPFGSQPSTSERASVESGQQASAIPDSLQSRRATKTDYGWLRDALWSRIERLKGYPYIARTNRWEGLVVLEAVINNEGQLVDLKIAASSGHSILDQDAMEVMRKSCPLRLKHSLGRSEVTMRVPISYKLR